MRYFVGIDIGTGTSKGVLIDEDCHIVAQASVSHETDNPRPGWFEHDAERVWWGDFCSLSHMLLDRAGISPEAIGCIGFSALGCDCVPTDAEGTALAPAVLYGVDSRSAPQIAQLLAELGPERCRELIGHDPCSSDIAPKVLWFKDNHPKIHELASKFLTASSYLCAKLTGRFTIDRYLAEDFLPMYDRETWEIDSEHCGKFCRPDQMAEVMSATDIAGTLSERAAEQTGLAAGTPVLVGTGDSGAEAISTGVTCPGDLMVQLGSSCYFIYLANQMIDDARLWPGTFIIPGIYGVCAGTNTAGSLNDPDARGTFFGLTLSHTRGHMVRAALEGIAFTVAAHVDILEREHGLPIQRIRVVGGGTKNPVWLQAVADACGRTIETARVTVGASYGDALMAAMGGGAFDSWEELANHIEPGRVVEPNPAVVELYRERRIIFDELYRRNDDLMHQLARS